MQCYSAAKTVQLQLLIVLWPQHEGHVQSTVQGNYLVHQTEFPVFQHDKQQQCLSPTTADSTIYPEFKPLS
jgi:hypothetical protein